MKKMIPLILAAVMLLGACSMNVTKKDTPNSKQVSYLAALKAQPVEAVDKNFASGVDLLGFKSANLLYNKDENLAISPVSIELALAMTRSGAKGDTANEMAKALGLNGLSDEQIAAACKSLMWRANTGGMKAANSLWVNGSYSFSKDFIDGCTNDYMADVMPLQIPGAMKAINSWVSDKTKGKIDGIISQELDPSTPMVLCNALYFLGDWETPFEANDTHDGDFSSPSGTVTAKFMNSDWHVPYYQNDKFSMISLSFKSKDGEGKYAMAFILPKEGEELSGMMASIDSNTFSGALSGMQDQQVLIKLPKFKFTFGASLADTLKALGMKTAFSGSADFSGMTGGQSGLFISDVLHKCYIRVDEKGAEAAAVTSALMAGGAAPSKDIKQFYADRPFAFAIYSTEDGVIDFLGAVNDPTK